MTSQHWCGGTAYAEFSKEHVSQWTARPNLFLLGGIPEFFKRKVFHTGEI